MILTIQSAKRGQYSTFEVTVETSGKALGRLTIEVEVATDRLEDVPNLVHAKLTEFAAELAEAAANPA